MSRKWATAGAILALAAALAIYSAHAVRDKDKQHDGAIDNHSQSKRRDTYEAWELRGVSSNVEEQALQEEAKEIQSEQTVAEAGAAADEGIWTKKELNPGTLSIFDTKKLKENSDDYYYTIGVPTNSDPKKIRAAYLKSSLLMHPDKNRHNPEAKENFQQLATAYQVLSDPRKRTEYDTKRKWQAREKKVRAVKAYAGKWTKQRCSDLWERCPTRVKRAYRFYTKNTK